MTKYKISWVTFKFNAPHINVSSFWAQVWERGRVGQPHLCEEESLSVEIGYKDLSKGIGMGLSFWVVFLSEF